MLLYCGLAAKCSHPLAKPLPEGFILQDMMKEQWKVGVSGKMCLRHNMTTFSSDRHVTARYCVVSVIMEDVQD